jgi:ABC-type uncharacterized transport system substrate-binding protein
VKISRLALILTLALLAVPRAADAQQPAKLPRIGILHLSPPASPSFQVFLQGLRDLGYVEGRNIAIEYRWPHDQPEQLPTIATELVQLNVEVIVAADPTTIAAAKRATNKIPIVMAVSADPVAAGFVASLAQPGENITGLSLVMPELAGKRLELLKETVPHLRRIALLWSPRAVHHPPLLHETEQAAKHLGLALQRVEATGSDDLDKAFQAAVKGRARALLALNDPVYSRNRARIAELGLKYRLPTMTAEPGFAEAGGLMTYGPNILESWRRAATYVDKILKGAKPADLPVEQPTRFELVINMKTAKALGLTIPPSLLLRANQVIE